jgi:hypothetical protein
MYFHEDAIKNMADRYMTLDERSEALTVGFCSFDFKNDRAREFAAHGFSRRLRTMTHCINNVFALLAPDDETIPTSETCIDATAYVQAFLFNVFGALDNLAWIWVQEKDIRNDDGGQLKDTRVGLGKKYREIKRTFSNEFREYLKEQTDWFKHLADFRHALAHRIPLYIPRYAVVNSAEYDDLQRQKDALYADPVEYDRLTAEQMKHVQFQPVMRHSFSEKSPNIVFHPQILNDFAIVEEIGKRMLIELERNFPPVRLPKKPGCITRLWRTLRECFVGSD